LGAFSFIIQEQKSEVGRLSWRSHLFLTFQAANGQHLVELIRHSDEVLDVLLLMAGRQQVAAANKLVDVRNKLAETIQQVDELMGEGRPKE
jgi:hypothetical protein